MSSSKMVAGYAAAQAMPGPLFTLSAYAGATGYNGKVGVPGAVVATAAIFLPTFLLIAAVAPFYAMLAANERFARALSGANASVVGLLASAFVTPIWAPSYPHAAGRRVRRRGIRIAHNVALAALGRRRARCGGGCTAVALAVKRHPLVPACMASSLLESPWHAATHNYCFDASCVVRRSADCRNDWSHRAPIRLETFATARSCNDARNDAARRRTLVQKLHTCNSGIRRGTCGSATHRSRDAATTLRRAGGRVW